MQQHDGQKCHVKIARYMLTRDKTWHSGLKHKFDKCWLFTILQRGQIYHSPYTTWMASNTAFTNRAYAWFGKNTPSEI